MIEVRFPKFLELRTSAPPNLVVTQFDNPELAEEFRSWLKHEGVALFQARWLGSESGEGVLGAGVRTIEEAQREAVLTALKKTNGSRREAAKILGVGERTLFRWIEKWWPENKYKHPRKP